ncbi:basic leucine zipper 43-like [Argentina anserina]|uniref:basic leucine zipper 43-like n=1 Tax=Argentina anserina TaxID=57926 RepID=UPI00217677D0|nr:basic leucine zipper 43-like [Potentilla anserina]
MQPTEATGLHYLVPSGSLSSPYPPHFSMTSTTTPNNPASAFWFNRFSAAPLYNNYQFPSHLVPQEVSNNNNPQQPCSFSSNSTSDEADEQQLSLINERKQRRMISNRESARRSRMRKQKHLDELWSQVVWLRNENHKLVDKLNHVSESHDRVLQENAQLKEETSELHQMLSDLQLHSPNSNYHPSLRDQLEVDVPCNTAYLRAESSNQPITTSSMDLLG